MRRRLPVSLVAACSLNRVIGRRGRLPWSIPCDWSFFATATQRQVLIVGRRSFEEFGAPVPNRHTIVVSATRAKAVDTGRDDAWSGVAVASSLEEAIALANEHPRYTESRRIFIGGGARLYRDALEQGLVESCYITRVHLHIDDGDAFLPAWTAYCPELAYSAAVRSPDARMAEATGSAAVASATPKTSLEVYKQSFREYLWRTHAVDSEAELDALMALLHEPLPVSFRLNLHRPDAKSVQARLREELQFPSNTFFHNDVAVNPPQPIPWYPLPEVAWQLDCGRVALSKTAPRHAAVKAFHSCLLEATDRGTIDRQEAVSMLPVLFLGVAPGHRVLDMCASPGSKTTQALDFLAGSAAAATAIAISSSEKDALNGVVVANDLDKKRAYMLVHRLSRNTLRNAVVTCGSGITFPGLYDPRSGALQRTNAFDRVLCDVPCSGDGTLRKNQALWKEWHIGQGLTLHATQLALALRGAALLRVGGVMVYSTCSFNPVENEAVVAELLRRADGALELEDVSATLPALVARRGRARWPVGWRSKSKSTHKGHLFANADVDGGDGGASSNAELHQWFNSYSELPQELRGQRVLRSMFPPEDTSGAIAKELHKTLRLIPTDQNSGGFFIAVLRKTRELPGDEQQGLTPLEEELELKPPAAYVCKLCEQPGHFMKSCAKYTPEGEFDVAATAPQPKKQRTSETEEDATGKSKSKSKAASASPKPRETLYRRLTDDAWALVQTFYGIEDASVRSRLWCRSDTAANVNYVDDEISAACLAGDALEIVNTGLKVFTKLTEKGETFYRPAEEALGFIDSFFTKRRLAFDASDVLLLLNANSHAPIASLSSTAQQSLEGVAVGPAVARVAGHEHVAINVWVGNGAVLPRVSKTLKAELEAVLRPQADTA